MTNAYLKGDEAKAITGQFIEVDDELNEESNNLVTNSAIANTIATLQNKINILESLTMQPIHTAPATLKGSNNQIIQKNIVTALSLEKGDVIQFIADSGSNQSRMHTVETIIDNNTIVVNYEHCGERGNGSLKLFDYSGSDGGSNYQEDN